MEPEKETKGVSSIVNQTLGITPEQEIRELTQALAIMRATLDDEVDARKLVKRM